MTFRNWLKKRLTDGGGAPSAYGVLERLLSEKGWREPGNWSALNSFLRERSYDRDLSTMAIRVLFDEWRESEKPKKPRRTKLEKSDGLGPYEIKKIREALRQVWQRSRARAIVIKRCTGKDGFEYCEECLERTPGVKVDHTIQVGEVGDGFIQRLFCPSKGMRGLCRECHNEKTAAEKVLNPPKPRKKVTRDFF